METLDKSDRKILNALQRDCTLSLDQLAELAALSRNAVWRRIKAMEARGIIRARVALLDPGTLGLGLSVFMLIRAGAHSPDWSARFSSATPTPHAPRDVSYLVPRLTTCRLVLAIRCDAQFGASGL